MKEKNIHFNNKDKEEHHEGPRTIITMMITILMKF